MILATRPTELVFWPICIYHRHQIFDTMHLVYDTSSYIEVGEINGWLEKSRIPYSYNWADGESTWHLKNNDDATVFLLRWS